MSTALAEVIKDPVIAVPSCAQCKTQMVLQRIEPDPVTGRDVNTYICRSCGLADQVEIP
jgi:hypothetical protein